MRKRTVFLVGTLLWAASLYVKVGSITVSGKTVPIYGWSAYDWMREILNKPLQDTFTGGPVMLAFALCLIFDLVHFVFCLVVAWAGLRIGRHVFSSRGQLAARVPTQSRMKTLPEIETEINQLAARIGAAGYVLPTYGRTEDGARPHIEVDPRGYHYVVVERGRELERITAGDYDELLYHVFEAVTFSLACKYELAHRVPSKDTRRLLFDRQVQLLSMLSPHWAGLERRDHERILRQHPFNDQ